MPFYQTAAFLLSAVPPAPGPSPADVTPFYQTTAFVNTAIFIGLVLASGFIGHWLGKGLRVADYGWKFGVILFAIVGQHRGHPPRLAAAAGHRLGRRIDPGLQGR